MTKANSPSFSKSSNSQDSSPQVDHGLFPTSLGAEEDDASSAQADGDNGGGTSGNHGNGTAG